MINEDIDPIIVNKNASYDFPNEVNFCAGFVDIEVSGESGIEKNVTGIVLKKEFETERDTINVKRSIVF